MKSSILKQLCLAVCLFGLTTVVHAQNVGIGTTSPQSKLDIQGAALLRGGQGSGTYTGTQLLLGYNGANSYMHGIKTRHNSGQDATNAIDFYVWDYGTNGVTDEPTKLVMTIDGNSSTGGVGIGNSAPLDLLNVGEVPVNSGDQRVGLRVYSNLPGSWKGGAAFGYDDASVMVGELNDNAVIGGHAANLNAWNDLLINPDGGSVGIGVSASGGSVTPQGKLQVKNGSLVLNRQNNNAKASYLGADLVIGDNNTTRGGYTGTNGSHIFLQSSAKSAITVLDESDNLGQISYENLKWTIGEDIGWGTQTINLPNLSGSGSRIVKVNAGGDLTASNSLGTVDVDDINIRGIELAAFMKNPVTGGGTISWDGSTFSWTDRIIVIPAGAGNGAHFNTAPWGGNSSPLSVSLGSWNIAYMRPSDADYTTTGGSYNPIQTSAYGSYDPEENDVVVAIHNGDDGMLYTAWGVVLKPGESYSTSQITYDDRTINMKDNSYHYYGPNSSWGAYLQVGGNGRLGTTASVAATNGNLHLDAADGNQTYINYYNQGDTYINAQGGNVGIGTSSTTHKLTVNGRIKSTGINETSDARLKENVAPVASALDKVLQIEGVTYTWKQGVHPTMQLEEGVQYGLIAQQLEQVIPELVDTDSEGWKSIEYSHLVPVLIEAIKEQDKKITALEQDNNTLTNLACENEMLKNKLEQYNILFSTVDMDKLLQDYGNGKNLSVSK